MDKLEPILRYRFWILCGLAIVIAPVGWFLGTGSYKTAIAERETKINGALSAPAQVQVGAPNATFAPAVLEEVKKKSEELTRARDQLFTIQKEKQVWPPSVADVLKEKLGDDFKEKIDYRDELGEAVREEYKQTYEGYVRNEVNDWLDPYRLPPNASGPSGNVLVDWPNIPFQDVEEWSGRTPFSWEVWDAQEDIWLLKALFKAVGRVNQSRSGIVSAPIKRVEAIELRGGNRATAVAVGSPGATPAAPGETGMTAGSDQLGMEDDDGMSGLTGIGGLRGNRTGGVRRQPTAGGVADVAIDLDADFGSDANSATNTLGAGLGSELADPTSTAMVDPTTGLPAATGPAPGEPNRATLRYIDDGTTTPFLTRGFYLVVVMDHQKVLDFVAELKGSPWPVHITRMHQVSLDAGSYLASGSTTRSNFSGSSPFNPPAGRLGSGGGIRRPTSTGRAGDLFSNLAGPFPPTTRSTLTLSPIKQRELEKAQNKAEADFNEAMKEPSLARVAISGWMTIYLEPKEEVVPADPNAPTTSVPGETPSELDDGVTPTDPADPNSEATLDDQPTDTVDPATPSDPATDLDDTGQPPAELPDLPADPSPVEPDPLTEP